MFGMNMKMYIVLKSGEWSEQGHHIVSHYCFIQVISSAVAC
mgnify:CR=1 FL=1